MHCQQILTFPFTLTTDKEPKPIPTGNMVNCVRKYRSCENCLMGGGVTILTPEREHFPFRFSTIQVCIIYNFSFFTHSTVGQQRSNHGSSSVLIPFVNVESSNAETQTTIFRHSFPFLLTRQFHYLPVQKR